MLQYLRIVPGTRRDIEALAQYHYIKTRIACPTHIWKVAPRPKQAHRFPDPIAVTVFCNPVCQLRARNLATQNYFTQIHPMSERMRVLNSKIAYGCRLIVDPRFRKLGLATLLIRHSLPRVHKPLIETLMPYGIMVDMLQKLGFRLYQNPMPTWYTRCRQALLATGLTEDALLSPAHVLLRLNNLEYDLRAPTFRAIQTFINHFASYAKIPHSLARTTFLCHKLDYPKCYLLYDNPALPNYRKSSV